jgi:hypothetical protein
MNGNNLPIYCNITVQDRDDFEIMKPALYNPNQIVNTFPISIALKIEHSITNGIRAMLADYSKQPIVKDMWEE